LLENADEFANVGKRVPAFGEEMDVIGHYTKSMKEEIVPGRVFFEETQNILSDRRIAQVGFTGVAANGDEVAALIEIVRGRPAGIFAVVGHDRADIP